jgi:hypothetical protein
MKQYSSGDLRTFGLVGHATSGKTTLAEAMLACGGAIGRMGNVTAGTTTSDYHPGADRHLLPTRDHRYLPFTHGGDQGVRAHLNAGSAREVQQLANEGASIDNERFSLVGAQGYFIPKR